MCLRALKIDSHCDNKALMTQEVTESVYEVWHNPKQNMEGFSGKLQASNCRYLERKRVQTSVYHSKLVAGFEVGLREGLRFLEALRT